MIVTFRSAAFNTSTPEKHFVSPRAYGGDLANWLIYELARHDAAVEPMIGQKEPDGLFGSDLAEPLMISWLGTEEALTG
jgi:hypothetical protein